MPVGIGEDAVESLLRDIASGPEDYFYAEGAEAILQAFRSVTELIWRDKTD